MYITEDKILFVLESAGVDYKQTGKNIGVGAVGVCCPYCGDTNYHCGIFRENGRFSCWRCGTRGSFSKLMWKLSGLNLNDIEAILAAGFFRPEEEAAEIEEYQPPDYPDCTIDIDKIDKEATPLIVRKIKTFLLRRGFDYEDCAFWGAKFCYAGDFGDRLILPVNDEDGKYISYQGRAIYDLKGVPKYKNVPKINIKDFLYGLDRIDPSTDYLIVTEGALDVWRLRGVAVATFGAVMTSTQKNKVITFISNRVVQTTLIIAYDADKNKEAVKLGEYFSPVVDTKVLQLPEGADPDTLGLARIMELIENTSLM